MFYFIQAESQHKSLKLSWNKEREGCSSLRNVSVFIGLLFRNAQHEAAADRAIVCCCGTFELLSQVCLVCQCSAGLCKQIWVRTLPQTHPAHTKMPFCLVSNQGLPLQTLPFLFSLSSHCYARLCEYEWRATPCIKKPSIGLSEFLSVLCLKE